MVEGGDIYYGPGAISIYMSTLLFFFCTTGCLHLRMAFVSAAKVLSRLETTTWIHLFRRRLEESQSQ